MHLDVPTTQQSSVLLEQCDAASVSIYVSDVTLELESKNARTTLFADDPHPSDS